MLPWATWHGPGARITSSMLSWQRAGRGQLHPAADGASITSRMASPHTGSGWSLHANYGARRAGQVWLMHTGSRNPEGRRCTDAASFYALYRLYWLSAGSAHVTACQRGVRCACRLLVAFEFERRSAACNGGVRLAGCVSSVGHRPTGGAALLCVAHMAALVISGGVACRQGVYAGRRAHVRGPRKGPITAHAYAALYFPRPLRQ